jgi:DNA-directed RNA polymerase specialized sigma24 family protein
MDLDPVSSWPHRFLLVAASLKEPLSAADRDGARAELWTLLQVALLAYVRRHARRLPHLPVQDIREVADDKASELFSRLDTKDWDPSASSPAQLCAFLAMVARNGVVDFHRVRGREVPVTEGPPSAASPAHLEESRPDASPEAAADGETYAAAILDCVGSFTARARRAWFLRVLYELDSADIARDPQVRSTPAGVDTMLARCRARMRACLEGKGLALGPLPPGTFVRLWDRARRGGRG